MTKSYDAMWWISIALGVLAALHQLADPGEAGARGYGERRSPGRCVTRGTIEVASTRSSVYEQADRRRRGRRRRAGGRRRRLPALRQGGLSRARCRPHAGQDRRGRARPSRPPAAAPRPSRRTPRARRTSLPCSTAPWRPAAGAMRPIVVVFNAGNNQRIDFREVTAELFEDFWRVGCFARLPRRARGGAPARAARPRHGDLHRRLGQPARQAGLRAVRRRQGGPAHDLAEHGARVRRRRHPRRPRGHRRRHRRPPAAEPARPSCSRSAARTACSTPTPSPRPTGRSTASRARPGARRSICGPSRSHFERRA